MNGRSMNPARQARAWVVAMLLGIAAVPALAADANKDGIYKLNELMNTDAQYRETWQSLVKKEERLPDWIMNLDGTASPMQAKEDDGDKYLVGGLCKDADCKHDRLFVAFSWDKSEVYGLYVQVPEALPADKSPSKHATFRWLGKPDDGQKQLLDEQLKSDPNWY